MAISFNDVNGEAKKTKIDYFKFEDGKNEFRMVGEILPRYVYWKKTPDGSNNMSIECLGFDRQGEKFTNTTKDWFKHYFPSEKCTWSYLVKVFDEKDGKLKVLGLKKKLFAAILDMAANHLGDPTDIDNGWICVVNRKKTGPLPYNVEYTLDQLSCKKSALTEKQVETYDESGNIEDSFPLPTSDEQKVFIEKVWFSEEIETEKDVDNEDTEEFKKRDDIPY